MKRIAIPQSRTEKRLSQLRTRNKPFADPFCSGTPFRFQIRVRSSIREVVNFYFDVGEFAQGINDEAKRRNFHVPGPVAGPLNEK